jgi:hypothetical protein
MTMPFLDPKPFDELVANDYVGDMHDGLAALAKRYTVVSAHQWRTEGAKAFPAWQNKHLRVLGPTLDGSLVCGYNYDGMFAGIVVIKELERS